jgi:hypothetical protein
VCVKFCKKRWGSWKGVFLTEGVLVSVFDAFSGAIQQTGAQTYP